MRRIGTGELNRAMERIAERRPPSSKAQQARILYATQVKTSPPTFVLFVNNERAVDRQYLAFVQKHLRAELGFEHVPLRLLVRGREKSRKEGSSR
jgi:GTP-binding protein